MSSIYTVSTFICICLYVQAPVQGALTHLTELSRTEGDGTWQLEATFEASSPVEARWQVMDGGQMVTNVAEQASGQTRFEVDKSSLSRWARIYLLVGNVSSHYMRVDWNLKGQGPRTARLDYRLSTVTPAYDLVFTPGQTTTVTIAVKEDQAKGLMSLFSHDAYVRGFYSVNDAPLISYDWPPDAEQTTKSANGVTTTTITFRAVSADTVSISGHFRTFLEGDPDNKETSPFQEVREYIDLAVHEEGKPALLG